MNGMASKTPADNDDDVQTSKLGVLVPEHVQQDNRSLVLYRHNGSKRNKLGPETTDRITHGLAMYFWRFPSELEDVAHSEYVDDPEAFKKRIQQYQDKHLDDTLVVARNLLHGSLAHTESRHSNKPTTEPQDENEEMSYEIGTENMSRNRLGGTPRLDDVPRDKSIPQQKQDRARERIEGELDQLIGEKVREQMKVVERRMDKRLSEIENGDAHSADEQDRD